jgi:SAM-dependent methyltransferase
VGVDISEGMLAAARDIARQQGVAINYRLGDAEALPFNDGTFDAAISSFGVMFAPDQQSAATELARVCRRGGDRGMDPGQLCRECEERATAIHGAAGRAAPLALRLEHARVAKRYAQVRLPAEFRGRYGDGRLPWRRASTQPGERSGRPSTPGWSSFAPSWMSPFLMIIGDYRQSRLTGCSPAPVLTMITRYCATGCAGNSTETKPD